MKDQASVGSESPTVKYQRALDLFTESVMKPDHELRGCAHNQGCYEDLMEIREHVLNYLSTFHCIASRIALSGSTKLFSNCRS